MVNIQSTPISGRIDKRPRRSSRQSHSLRNLSSPETDCIIPFSTLLNDTKPIKLEQKSENETGATLTIVEKLPLFRLRTATIVKLAEFYSDFYRELLARLADPIQKTEIAKKTWQKIAEQTNLQFTMLRALSSDQAMMIYAIYQKAKYNDEAKRQ